MQGVARIEALIADLSKDLRAAIQQVREDLDGIEKRILALEAAPPYTGGAQ